MATAPAAPVQVNRSGGGTGNGHGRGSTADAASATAEGSQLHQRENSKLLPQSDMKRKAEDTGRATGNSARQELLKAMREANGLAGEVDGAQQPDQEDPDMAEQ